MDLVGHLRVLRLHGIDFLSSSSSPPAGLIDARGLFECTNSTIKWQHKVRQSIFNYSIVYISQVIVTLIQFYVSRICQNAKAANSSVIIRLVVSFAKLPVFNGSPLHIVYNDYGIIIIINNTPYYLQTVPIRVQVCVCLTANTQCNNTSRAILWRYNF